MTYTKKYDKTLDFIYQLYRERLKKAHEKRLFDVRESNEK